MVSFARMLIEINITKPLPDEIKVLNPNGRLFTQPVTYDWRPMYYEKCQTIGHKCAPMPNPMPPARHGGARIVIVSRTGLLSTTMQPEMQMEGQECSQRLVNASPVLNMTNFPQLSSTKRSTGGVNKRYKQKEVRKILTNKHIKLAGLIETRVRQHNAQRILQVSAPGWGHIDNYRHANNGRVWLIWDSTHFTVMTLRVEDQLIHCLVTNGDDITCRLTVIYGYNSIEQRKSLWGYLKDLVQGIDSPWLICRDFNALIYPQDRLSSNPVQYAEIRDFGECLQDLHLNEVAWRRDYYTWNNKQYGEDRVCSRLDRALGNHEWMMT
ncbi:uncharacterized protein LOC132062428 [Lycium ferocissimum]|uniref:uncharacterized protein LOC132062428 n=1 Tax=Lycium ferocissimum TaxID=112874 RepID=UPI002815DBC8|nr:uncharacterized protein LOC132062428 [Lycium ferocissimum]